MAISVLQGIIFILLLHICRSQDTVTSRTPFPTEINLPSTVITIMEPKLSDVSMGKAESVEHNVENMKGGPVETEGREGDMEKAGAAAREGTPSMTDERASLAEDKNTRESYDDQLDDGIDQMADAGDEAGSKNEAGGGSEEEDRMGVQEGYEEDAGVENFENYGEDVEVEFGDEVEVYEEVRDEVPEDIFASKGANESEIESKDLTPAPLDTYVPPRSHGGITRKSHLESNAMGGDIGEDTNNFNEMMTPNSELLNLAHTQTMPTLDDSLEDIAATPSSLLNEDEDRSQEQIEDTTNGSALGIETWKIGTISAAIFLVLEAAVIVVYCLKYRKRMSRQTVSNVEAGRPVKRESNIYTVNGGDGHARQINCLKTSQKNRKGNYMRHSPGLGQPSSENSSSHARTSVL